MNLGKPIGSWSDVQLGIMQDLYRQSYITHINVRSTFIFNEIVFRLTRYIYTYQENTL